MKFYYTARTKGGELKTGEIEASSRDVAVNLLQKYDIFVTSLVEKPSEKSLLEGFIPEKKIPKKELAVFSRQLGIMLESRVPVVQSLSSLAVQHYNPRIKKTLQDITASVEEGKPLSEAFAGCPKVFSDFYVNLVKSGEASGKISEALYFLSDSLEQEDDIASRFKQAITYPLLVLLTIFAVIAIIIIVLVPRVEELAKASNAALPLFTRMTLAFYNFLSFSWWMFSLAALFAVLWFAYYIKTKSGRGYYDALSLKIPYLKDVLKKNYLAIFCGNVATLISAGVSITKSLEITEGTLRNSVYRDAVAEIRNGVAQGEKISSAMSARKDCFPPFVVRMVKVGEDTGKLDKTLTEVASFYRKEIQRAILAFSVLLEPLLIIFLGIIVTFVAVSVLAPLYGILVAI